MTGNLQPLDQKFPITNPDGTPTEYFIRWAQQRQIDIGDGVSGAQAQEIVEEYLANHGLQAGSGIKITPSGKISDNPTIAAEVQPILDQITDVRGSVLFRGAAAWQALAPGIAGRFLKTNGPDANPEWAEGGGGGGGGGGVSVPTLVQKKIGAFANIGAGITMDAAPTSGNILIAISINAVLATTPSTGSGWTNIDTNSSTPRNNTAWRIAGASETALQTPTGLNDGGAIAIWEFTPGFAAFSGASGTATSTNVSVAFNSTFYSLIAACLGVSVGAAGRRTVETTTLSGSLGDIMSVVGSAALVGGAGISMAAGHANKLVGTIPSVSASWPTSEPSKAMYALVA